MYNTGVTEFLAAACSPNRLVDTKAVLNKAGGSITLTTDDIVSYKLTYASTAGNSFTAGNFVADQLEMSLNMGSPLVSEVDFKHTPIDSISPQAGIQIDGENISVMVFVPMGEFYPEKDGIAVGDDGYVSIKALSIPPILYTQFSSGALTLPCTIAQALTQISSDIGIPINVSEEDFPNLSVTLTESFSLTTTYREALMYIAETLGAYVRMGREGEIHFKKVFSGLVNIGCVLDENYLFSVNKQESTVKPFQYIGIKANKDDLGVTHEVEGVATNCRYDIIDNPLTYGHPEDFLAGLVEPLEFTEFYPSKISLQGRPDIDVGDVLEYAYKGVTYILPICNHVFEYNGGFKTTVESVGSDQLSSSSVDSGLKTQIQALKQNINTLVRDLTKTQSQITEINGDITEMSTVLQTVDALKTQILKIDGDLTEMSTVTQEADQLRIDFTSLEDKMTGLQDEVNTNQETLLSYFDFKPDGLVIGINTSNIKLKLTNDRIQFLRDGTDEVAYFSDGKLYVNDAHFLNRLVLGNFEFKPRENGNLSLIRRGG